MSPAGKGHYRKATGDQMTTENNRYQRSDAASDAWEPYHLSVLVGGRAIDFLKPLPDPFHSTEVTVGWRDLLRGLLRRRLVVSVSVGAHRETVESVLALNPDHLGDADSPSWPRADAGSAGSPNPPEKV